MVAVVTTVMATPLLALWDRRAGGVPTSQGGTVDARQEDPAGVGGFEGPAVAGGA